MLYIQQKAVINNRCAHPVKCCECKKWMVTGTSGNAGVEVCYEYGYLLSIYPEEY
jgi:hypothetical protein